MFLLLSRCYVLTPVWACRTGGRRLRVDCCSRRHICMCLYLLRQTSAGVPPYSALMLAVIDVSDIR